MRVSSLNSIADSANLQNLQSSLASTRQEIATGQRIYHTSDDPKAMGSLLSSQSAKRQISAFEVNRQLASDVVQEGHIQIANYHSHIYVKSQELAYSTAGRSPEDLKLLAVEVNGLIDTALGLLQSKSTRGGYLFGGDEASNPPFSPTYNSNGWITNVQYVGASTNREISVSTNDLVSPQLEASKASAFAGYINNLITLRDALDVANMSNIDAAAQAIQGDEIGILSCIADLGTKAMRIENLENTNTLQYENYARSISGQVEIDLSSSITALSRLSAALEGAFKASAIAANQNIFNYL